MVGRAGQGRNKVLDLKGWVAKNKMQEKERNRMREQRGGWRSRKQSTARTMSGSFASIVKEKVDPLSVRRASTVVA